MIKKSNDSNIVKSINSFIKYIFLFSILKILFIFFLLLYFDPIHHSIAKESDNWMK